MHFTVRNLPRLDDEGIRDMAKGLVTGERWAHENIHSAMWFCLGCSITEAAAKQVGILVGSTQGVVRYMNGEPMTLSGWVVHKDDWEKVVAKVEAIREAME